MNRKKTSGSLGQCSSLPGEVESISNVRLPRVALLGSVLCGGYSTRMGMAKGSLVRPDGRTQLNFAIDLLRACVDSVVLSIRPGQSVPTPLDCPLIVDPLPDAGPMAGVWGSLLAAERESFAAVLCVPVDLPALNSERLGQLIVSWLSAPDHIVVAENAAGYLQPMVSLWPVLFQDALRQSLAESDRSLYRFIQSKPHRCVRFDDGFLSNVNTPEEWKNWYDKACLAGN